MMNTVQPIVNVNYNTIDIKYDCVDGNHFVYVGLGDQVRRLSFPDRVSAGAFISSMYSYTKLKG